MTTGGGHTSLSTTMSVLGVPVMAKDPKRNKLKDSMIETGKEEVAEQDGEFQHGVPAISVIVDGGWSKRAHKHS